MTEVFESVKKSVVVTQEERKVESTGTKGWMEKKKFHNSEEANNYIHTEEKSWLSACWRVNKVWKDIRRYVHKYKKKWWLLSYTAQMNLKEKEKEKEKESY